MKEFDTDKADVDHNDEFSITTRPVAHRPESLAFRVTVGDISVVYSGDTDVSENLVRLSHQADVLVCEAALPDELKAEGHLTPSLAGGIAEQAGAKRLVLTHLKPKSKEMLQAVESDVHRHYHGEVIVGEDLMSFEG